MGSFGLLSSASNSCVNMSNSMSEITEDGMRVIFLLIQSFQNMEYQSWEDTIRKKLNKEMMKNENFESQIKEKYGLSINEFARALGDEKLFKQVFLLPQYKPDKILNEIEEELNNAKEFIDMGLPYTEKELKEAIERINERKSRLSEHKFELILTECQASDFKNILFQNFVNTIYTF